ncbi:MAG: acetylornithine deacetylase [Alphaproteobacteria bacterium]|nr:acetylornithine deacetylase [Alphaproteobacteria bacterium]MDE2335678.1 acetylornithine deacetylase [Alphaproteobacteria bacterium]
MGKTVLSSKDMLKHLVGFDTVSANSNLDLIHWVRDYLAEYGVKSTLIHDAQKNKANLHAVIGPADKAGVVLSGHTDVVPVEGQAWDSDPFTLREHDGRLYGRGTCDMKGFIAVALAKVPEMSKRPLAAPLHLAFSYDEELGCLGAHDIARHLDHLPVKPKLCVVGEPTDMKAITGHKGICDFECTVRGKEAHSSLAPYAVNAVESAAELVAYIKSVARRMQNEGPFNKQFDPPFTTVHTGAIRGGTAVNIVPNLCEFAFEIRNIPEIRAEDLADEIRQYAFKTLEPRMKEIDPKSGFEIRSAASVPAFDIDNGDPAVAFVMALSGANAAEKVSFATEAGLFQNVGIPTVVCGPGSITQAHKPNEYVSIDQITKCENFMDRLAAKMCSSF